MKRAERAYLRSVHRALGVGEPFEDWVGYVVAVEVELHPGARATALHPATGIPVELRWEPGTDEVISFATALLPGVELPRAELHLSAYVAALGLARGLGGGPEVHVGSARISGGGGITATAEVRLAPAPGRQPNLAFYRALLDERDQLINDGLSDPTKELARRRGVKLGTVKSWLHRGHRYLQEGEQQR